MLASDFNPSFDELELDAREREVLTLLASDQNACFSFQGLRRRLGLHQETLTRTLKRLEEARVIDKTPEGYKVKRGSNAYFTVQTSQSSMKPIIDAYLPERIDVTILFQKLRGRWFGDFRWLGYSHDGDRLSMSWISEDGRVQLQARIGAGKISIAADSTSDIEEFRFTAAAYKLFDHVSKVAEEIVQHPIQTLVDN